MDEKKFVTVLSKLSEALKKGSKGYGEHTIKELWKTWNNWLERAAPRQREQIMGSIHLQIEPDLCGPYLRFFNKEAIDYLPFIPFKRDFEAARDKIRSFIAKLDNFSGRFTKLEPQFQFPEIQAALGKFGEDTKKAMENRLQPQFDKWLSSNREKNLTTIARKIIRERFTTLVEVNSTTGDHPRFDIACCWEIIFFLAYCLHIPEKDLLLILLARAIVKYGLALIIGPDAWTDMDPDLEDNLIWYYARPILEPAKSSVEVIVKILPGIVRIGTGHKIPISGEAMRIGLRLIRNGIIRNYEDFLYIIADETPSKFR